MQRSLTSDNYNSPTHSISQMIKAQLIVHRIGTIRIVCYNNFMTHIIPFTNYISKPISKYSSFLGNTQIQYNNTIILNRLSLIFFYEPNQLFSIFTTKALCILTTCDHSNGTRTENILYSGLLAHGEPHY